MLESVEKSKLNLLKNIKISDQVKILGMENLEIGEFIIIDNFSKIHVKNKMIIGDNVCIGSHTSISSDGAVVTIEDSVNIGDGVRICSSLDDHDLMAFGNKTLSDLFRNPYNANIKIGFGTLIGDNSVILPGVRVGHGCSILPNSVVTKDLDDLCIYAGDRKVGRRKENDFIEYLGLYHKSKPEERASPIFSKNS